MTDSISERDRLLSAIADHILAHGVSGLTLRGLSRAVGSNNRMLLYYFGSKERLVADAILAALSRFPTLAGALAGLRAPGRPLADRLHQVWLDISAPPNLPFLRLFFELFGLAAHRPERYRPFLDSVGHDWVAEVREVLVLEGAEPAGAQRLATEVVALWRGLQFALLSGADRRVVDASHADAARSVAARVRAGRGAAGALTGPPPAGNAGVTAGS